MKRYVLLFAVLSAMILTGCSPDTDNYLKAIPDNPVAMMKVNAGNLLDESELLENPIIKPMISTSASQLPQSMVDLFNEIVEEPEASGLDFDMPAVLAVVSAKPMNVVITLPVADKSRLEEMLQCFSDGDVEITTEGGVSRVNTYSNEFDIAYDDVKFVVALAETGANVMEYMNLQAGAVDNAEYNQFFSAVDDVVMFVSGDEIFDLVAGDPYFMYNVRHADDIDILKEISLLLTLNFENGYAELAVNCDLPEEYKEKYADFFVPSTKKHLKYVPEEAFFVLDMGCNTEDALESMSEDEIKRLGSALSLLGLNATALPSLSGEITFAVFGPAEAPMLVAIFDCNDPAVFNSVISTLSMFMPFEKVEENVYSFGNLGNSNYNLAYLDEKIFFVPAGTFDMIKDGSGVAPLDRNALDNRLVSSMGNAALLDCDKLISALGDGFEMGGYESLVSSFESARFEVVSPTRIVFRVTIKDMDINALKFAVDKAIGLYFQIR